MTLSPDAKKYLIIFGGILSFILTYIIYKKVNAWLLANKKSEGVTNEAAEGEKIIGVKPTAKTTTVQDLKTGKLNAKGAAILKTLVRELFKNGITGMTSDDSVEAAITQLKTVQDFQDITLYFNATSAKYSDGSDILVKLKSRLWDSTANRVFNYINALPKTIA